MQTPLVVILAMSEHTVTFGYAAIGPGCFSRSKAYAPSVQAAPWQTVSLLLPKNSPTVFQQLPHSWSFTLMASLLVALRILTAIPHI